MSPSRPGRRLKALAAVGFITALLVGTTAPAGAMGSLATLAPPPPPSGWYPVSSLTVTFQFDSSGLGEFPHENGDYEERIASVHCTGGTTLFHGPSSGNVVQITVFLNGDSPSPAGTEVACTARYERSLYFNCINFFGIHTCDSTFWFPGISQGGTFPDTVTNEAVFHLDGSAPTSLTIHRSAPPNADGWYRSPGTVWWTANDPNSGILSCTNVPFGGPDGTSKTIVGACYNNADRESHSTFTYNFDATPPDLAPTISPSSVTLNGSATADPNATDNLSGVATSSCGAIDTSTVGTHSVACTATDNAGNSRTVDTEYTVGYVASGFSAPVDPGALNVANSGQGIPLKWRVTDANGVPVTDLATVAVMATSLTCDLDITADQIEEYSAGLAGLQNLGDGYYQYNWKTPKSYAKSCKTLHLDLGNDVEITAAFRFAK